MTTDTQRTFAGVPIEGIPNRYTMSAKEQRPVEDLERVLLEAWSKPGAELIEYFTWQQYTPYFNDGDACIFSLYEVRAVPYNFDLGEDEHDEPGFSTWELTSDYMLKNYPENQKFAALVPALEHVNELCNGEFDAALNSTFGDPARVRVYRDRIVLDEYFEAPY